MNRKISVSFMSCSQGGDVKSPTVWMKQIRTTRSHGIMTDGKLDGWVVERGPPHGVDVDCHDELFKVIGTGKGKV